MIASRPGARRVLQRSYIADGVTPVGAFAALRRGHPRESFLLESAPAAQSASRYSIIGVGREAELHVLDGRCELSIDGVTTHVRESPLQAARRLLDELRPAPRAGGINPFLGAYGAASFEFAGCFERLPTLSRDGDPMPDLHLMIPRTLVVFDHFTHEMTVATLHDAEELDAICEAVLSARIGPLARSEPSPSVGHRAEPQSSDLPFEQAVARAQEAICAGEAFQVVVSQCWALPMRGDPFDAYRRLRAINPSPYLFYLDLGWGQLFGASPELLVRVDGDRATVRPLAGTRPRSDDADEDARLARELRRDAKERAEHVMLVDLGRNDLGRVSEPGSVRTPRLFEVEKYSHVMHMMSEVVSRLRRRCDALDCLAAAFPAGTVSGAPKIRAMELIAELECRRRGFYGGSVIRLGFEGALEACITLRAAHAYGGMYHVRAGAGIVADSNPKTEDAECRAKARAVLEAVACA